MQEEYSRVRPLEYTNAILNYEKEDREEETPIPGILEGSELLKYKSRGRFNKIKL